MGSTGHEGEGLKRLKPGRVHEVFNSLTKISFSIVICTDPSGKDPHKYVHIDVGCNREATSHDD